MTTEQIHDSRDILQKLDAVMKAVQCGKTVRDTFGGNVGGGTDVFKEALSYIPEIRAAFSTMLADIEMAREAFIKIGKLTYSRNYESTGQEYGIASKALSALDKYKGGV